jgi:hypothetical protein
MFSTRRIKMLKIIISAAIVASLAACGGGSGPDPRPDTEQTFHQEIFTVVSPTQSVTLAGRGATLQERRYDVAMQYAKAVVPGSAEYQAMLSDAGLQVQLVDNGKGGVTATIKLSSGNVIVITF